MARTPLGRSPTGRKPSLRGVLMLDIVNGKPRVRAWPRKRGSAGTPEQIETRQQFAAYQWAAKYISPQQMVDVMNGRAGTPILPRDALTAMWSGRLCAFILTNGKVMWPVVARTDTSTALDTITQTIGQLLIRGADGWEGFTPLPPNDGGSAILGLTSRNTGNASTSTTNRNRGNVFKPLADVVITGCTMIFNNTNSYDARLYRLNASNVIQEIVTTAPAQAGVTGKNVCYRWDPVLLTAGEIYALCFIAASGTWAASFPASGTDPVGANAFNRTNAVNSTNHNPAVGDTLAMQGSTSTVDNNSLMGYFPEA